MRHSVATFCLVFVCSGSFGYPVTGMQSACADEARTVAGSTVVAPIVEFSQIVKHAGVKGMWFPMPTARRLLRDLHIGRGAIKLGSKLELRLEAEIERSRLLNHQLQSAIREIKIWKDTAEARARKLESIAAPPWYKQPYTWAVLGFLIGAGSTTLIAWSLNK